MKQEDKELLLKDLCARLPYRVKCKYYDCCEGDYDEGAICGFERQEYIQIDGVCIHVEEVRPYLFPLSSMTEEQKKECNFADDLDSDILDAALCTNHYYRTGIPAVTYNLVDWCIKNHFDYRGLIPMGLAKDATGLNIYGV